MDSGATQDLSLKLIQTEIVLPLLPQTQPLTVLRDGDWMDIRVRSAARSDFFKSPRLH